jgi:apolipoprotein N-acyltransferase
MHPSDILRYRKTLALVTGAIAATGFQPLALWPLTLIAVALLLHLVATAPDWKRALLTGWLFGVGHFSIGNNWIATAFTYQAEMPVWLGWIAVVLLALYLAVYPALAALGAWLLGRNRNEGAFLLAFAGCWIVSEWLRSWVFTGFAWNPLGMVALGGFERPGLAGIAPWTGTYALSGLIVVLAGCWRRAPRNFAGGRRIGAAVLVLLPAALLLAPWTGGARKDGKLPFTLVQPDTRQEELNDSAKFEEQFQVTAALTKAREPGQRRLVLWPESGIPDYLREGYPQYFYEQTTFMGDPGLARERIGRVIGPDSLLLTGAVDIVMKDGRAAAADNAVTAIDSRGRLLPGYAKAHLVPYGEYLPMKWLLEPLGLSRLVAGSIEFRSGPGPRTQDYGAWGKIGFQVCYEIIFSGQVVDPAQRPDMIFNPSNDGWFGTWGPPQHLAQARMRAIEEGLPVLRSTTTGISAVVDADGVVRQFLPLKARGRIDGLVPPAHAPTLFSRTGNMLALGWAAVLLALSLVVSRRARR